AQAAHRPLGVRDRGRVRLGDRLSGLRSPPRPRAPRRLRAPRRRALCRRRPPRRRAPGRAPDRSTASPAPSSLGLLNLVRARSGLPRRIVGAATRLVLAPAPVTGGG